LASDLLDVRKALEEKLERAEELLRSISECLVRARARLLDVIDREGLEPSVRSDLVIALGRINMAIRASDELRVKVVWGLKNELRKL
jgi:hypothetical protein